MPDMTITCNKCKCAVTHICNEDARDALVALFKFRPEIGFPAALKKGNPYIVTELDADKHESDDVDQPDIPFFSEVYLYALLGKEDARTILALVNNIIRSMGIEPYEAQHEAWKLLVEEKKNREIREAQNKEYLRRRKQRKEGEKE